MRKRIAFDTHAAIAAAWALLWAFNEKNKNDPVMDYRGQSTYLTASDIVRQVRIFARETLDGKPWGSSGRWGNDYGVRLPGDTLGAVRNWLSHQVSMGKLTCHNFGRGHVSGMRYRPSGMAMTEAEKITVAAKERRRSKPRPRHFSKGGMGGQLLCVAKPRSLYRCGRSKSWSTRDKSAVTCPRCLKLLAAMECTAA